MLDAAELLDVAVSAVVVGHKEAFLRDDLSGTAVSELHDRILEGVVDIVYLLRRKLASELLHVLSVHLLDERQQPHTFVCECTSCKEGQCGDDGYYSFHII